MYTYHPKITEQIPQTNYSVSSNYDTFSNTQFSLHQVYMANSDSISRVSSIYNVQPTSHTSKPRIYPSLPYSTKNLTFINKFNFQFSDLTDTEYVTLCNLLLEYITCYATH